MHEYEIGIIANIMPKDVDEARTLVPSLNVRAVVRGVAV